MINEAPCLCNDETFLSAHRSYFGWHIDCNFQTHLIHTVNFFIVYVLGLLSFMWTSLVENVVCNTTLLEQFNVLKVIFVSWVSAYYFFFSVFYLLLEQLSDSIAVCSPRLSPDHCRIVYFQCDVYGPHHQCNKLCMVCLCVYVLCFLDGNIV